MKDKLTQEVVREVLNTDDAVLTEWLVKIYEFQTRDEQMTETTNRTNLVGFTGADAHILSSFAKQYIRKGYLSPKQLAIARKKMPKYAGQIIRIHTGKQRCN